MRFFLTVLILLLLIAGGTACMKKEDDGLTARESIAGEERQEGESMKKEDDGLTSQERKMLEYVTEKYTGDSFTFYKSFLGVGNAYNCYVRSEQYPEHLITVRLYEGESEDIISENYIPVKYDREIRAAAERILTECCGTEFYLECGPTDEYSPASATSDTTFEEFAADPENSLTFNAIVRYDLSEAGKDEMCEKLKKASEKEGIRFKWGRITFETDKDPGEFNVKNYGVYLYKKTYDNCLEFGMEKPGTFTEIKWEK